jgi:mRNA-degrading endonuclease YafQ of YafQ-DinJ toxin-antitoxin module
MALELRTTTAFERDLRRVNKQGKDLDKLETQEKMPARCRPHPLRGIWAGRVTNEALILVRTGSHADLFGL